MKLLIEMGPLVAFFIANWKAGIFWGTGVFMVATAIALAASWIMTRKLAMVPLISAVFVALFGALTLWLQSDIFIKVKVTLINALFGAVLLGGVAFGKALSQTGDGRGDEARARRRGAHCRSAGASSSSRMAGLNEIVWRNFTDRSMGELQGLRPAAAHPGFRLRQCALHDQAHDRRPFGTKSLTHCIDLLPGVAAMQRLTRGGRARLDIAAIVKGCNPCSDHFNCSGIRGISNCGHCVFSLAGGNSTR